MQETFHWADSLALDRRACTNPKPFPMLLIKKAKLESLHPKTATTSLQVTSQQLIHDDKSSKRRKCARVRKQTHTHTLLWFNMHDTIPLHCSSFASLFQSVTLFCSMHVQTALFNTTGSRPASQIRLYRTVKTLLLWWTHLIAFLKGQTRVSSHSDARICFVQCGLLI